MNCCRQLIKDGSIEKNRIEVRKKLPTANVDRSAFRLALVNAEITRLPNCIASLMCPTLLFYFCLCDARRFYLSRGEHMPTQWVNTVCQTVLPVKVNV